MQTKCESCGGTHNLDVFTIRDTPELDRSLWTPGNEITLCEGCAIYGRSRLALVTDGAIAIEKENQ